MNTVTDTVASSAPARRKVCKVCGGNATVSKASCENQALVPMKIKLESESQQHFLEELFTTVPRFLVSPYSGLSSMGSSRNTTKTNNFSPLSDFESTKIAEIIHALDVVADERALPVVARSDDYYASFQSAEIYVRMFIKFCKQMNSFRLLNATDQLTVLKPFLFDILMIRFAFIVDLSNDDGGCWNTVNNEGATSTLAVPFNLKAISKIIKRQHDKFIENFEFTKVLQGELEDDPMIRDLLTALVMFRNHSAISCSEFIKYNFTFYSRLLQKYLEQKYASRAKAEQKLATLVQLMMTFDHIKNNERLLFYEMDLSQVPTVYYEIYDL
ncbi:Ligand binding domain of hormone receptors protein [Tyrophagus putrescentiae]|nr:Ligand binding domain of hormone receptors protein [Tyrophagus putrescentiae]